MKSWPLYPTTIKPKFVHLVARCIALGMLVSSLAACSSPAAKIDVIVRSPSLVAVQAVWGNYIDVAWFSDNQLIVAYRPDVAGRHAQGLQLWSLGLGNQSFTQLALPDPEALACEVEFFNAPVRLSKDLLAITRTCSILAGSESKLIIWDNSNKTAIVKYHYVLPPDAAIFAFAPDLSRSIFSSHTGIADSLRWADSSGYSDIDLGMDRARYPSWSPDGTTIVFFGARHLPGSAGPDWALQPDDLWSMPANCSQLDGGCRKNVSLLLSNIVDPLRVKWAPQGTWVVFDGNFQGDGDGIWLLNTQSHIVYGVAKGVFEKPDWSPDGKRIIVLAPPVDSPSNPGLSINPGLFILDVRDIVGL